MASHKTNLEAINALCVSSGGGGGHYTMIDAVNELCELQGVTGDHLTVLPALNAIDAGLGGDGDHLWILSALNSIDELVGGEGGHATNLNAWNSIVDLGFAVDIAAPSALTATYVSSTALNLAWTNGTTECDGHRIYYSTDNVTFSILDQVGPEDTTYAATGLTEDELYYFYVKSYENASESTASNKATAFTFDRDTTAAWYVPRIAAKVRRDGSNREDIWWDVLYGSNDLSDELPEGTSTVPYAVYYIVACQANFFFTGCTVGQTFVCPSEKVTDANNRLKRYNGNHLAMLQGITTRMPVYKATLGYSVLDGSDDFLKTAPFTYAQPCYVWGIVNPVAFTDGDYIWDGNANDTGNLKTIAPEGTMTGYIASGSTVSSVTGLLFNKFQILRGAYSGTNTFIQINNNSPSSTPSGSGTNAMGGFTFGCRNALSGFGNIAGLEIILRKDAHNAAVAAKIYNYLLSKMPPAPPTLSAANYTYDKVNLSATITAEDYDGVKWEKSTDGVTYSQMGDPTAYGVATYQATGLSAATEYYFRCRTYKGTVNGEYSDPVTITTYRLPLIFSVDMTELHRVRINDILMQSGHTCILDWGDGTVQSLTGASSDLIHSYTETGTYSIKVGGDIDYLQGIEFVGEVSPGEFYDQAVSFDWTDVVIPPRMINFHCYNIDHGGVWTSEFPSTIRVFHIGRRSNDGNGCTGTIDFSTLPAACYDLHVENHPNLVCDLEAFTIPDSVTTGFHHVLFANDEAFAGDVSFLSIPETLTILRLDNTAIEGDMSGITMPVNTSSGYDISATDTALTGVPRGAFETVINFDFNNCDLDATELDSVLSAIETRLTTYDPEYNATYDFAGAGNGSPSAAGLASIAAIEAIFDTAGKTISIIVNSGEG